jgi:5'-deoxynucleotidase YfbR-like HD superfamily hydrolase
VAKEIEKKWLFDIKTMPLSVFKKAGFEVKKIEQGYFPNSHTFINNDSIITSGLKIKIDKATRNKILLYISRGSNNLPEHVEIRWRISQSSEGVENTITIKGPETNDGSERAEIEFHVPSDIIIAAKKLDKRVIVKSRVMVPISTGFLEIDYYFQPLFQFASIEKEFKSQDDLAYFQMPAYFERIRPLDVTNIKAFKNKNLFFNPQCACDEWEKRKDLRFEHLHDFKSHTDENAIQLYQHWMNVDWYKKTLRWRGAADDNKTRRESDPEHSVRLAFFEWFGAYFDKSAKSENVIKRITYALDHDIPEFVTSDITYGTIAELQKDEREELQKWKAYSEKKAIDLLVQDLPRKAALVKGKMWDDYDKQNPDDVDARTVKGDDKIITTFIGNLNKWSDSAKSASYIESGLSKIPGNAYFSVTAVQNLPKIIWPKDLKRRISDRDSNCSKKDISDMRKCMRFIRSIFPAQDLERFAQKDGARKESVGDHTWRLAYMLSTFFDTFKIPDGFDYERAIKMCLIHDLAEIKIGDISHEKVFTGEITKAEKHNREFKAMKQITKNLPKALCDEIMGLWNEYEDTKTLTARFVRALDKIESTTHVMVDGVSYNPNVRGLHGNEYYAKVPELLTIVGIMKHQLKLDYATKGYEWRQEFENWKFVPSIQNVVTARAKQVVR